WRGQRQFVRRFLDDAWAGVGRGSFGSLAYWVGYPVPSTQYSVLGCRVRLAKDEAFMLTGKLVRVRFARDRIVPHYLDTEDAGWREVAERLLEMFRGQDGRTRGELDDDQREAFG